ncbi:MAG: cell division protein FtsH, partial [Deltaproteobacteria bacterium]
MRQQTKTLLVWIGLFAAVLLLVRYLNGAGQTEQVSYARFMEQVDQEWHRFKNTTLEIAVHPTHVDIEYEDGGKTVHVTGPVTEGLYDKLAAKGIDYRIEP